MAEDTIYEPDVIGDEAEPTPPEADELEKAFEEQVTGDYVPEDTAVDEDALREVATSMEWLIDLSYTISKEGVSQSDMQALAEIRAKVMSYGMTVTPIPALEHFSVGFTRQRSMLNTTISQEGILKTIVDTVKEWIRMFKDWIVKQIRRYQDFKANDERMARAIESAVRKIERVRQDTQKLKGLTFGKYSEDDDELERFRTELLSNPKLPRNNMTLSALGYDKAYKELTEFHQTAMTSLKALDRMVDGLIEAANGEADSFYWSERIGREMERLNAYYNFLYGENPEPDFIKKIRIPLSMPFLPQQKKVLSYQGLLDSYRRAADFIRFMERKRLAVEDPVLTDLVPALKALSESYVSMARLADFFKRYHQTQLLVLAEVYYAYANKEYTLAWKRFGLQDMLDEGVKRTGQKVDEELRKFVATNTARYGL